MTVFTAFPKRPPAGNWGWEDMFKLVNGLGAVPRTELVELCGVRTVAAESCEPLPPLRAGALMVEELTWLVLSPAVAAVLDPEGSSEVGFGFVSAAVAGTGLGEFATAGLGVDATLVVI